MLRKTHQNLVIGAVFSTAEIHYVACGREDVIVSGHWSAKNDAPADVTPVAVACPTEGQSDLSGAWAEYLTGRVCPCPLLTRLNLLCPSAHDCPVRQSHRRVTWLRTSQAIQPHQLGVKWPCASLKKGGLT